MGQTCPLIAAPVRVLPVHPPRSRSYGNAVTHRATLCPREAFLQTTQATKASKASQFVSKRMTVWRVCEAAPQLWVIPTELPGA